MFITSVKIRGVCYMPNLKAKEYKKFEDIKYVRKDES
jgi:hypothetical protein